MPFLITLLAGFSTLIGYLFIFLDNKENKLLISSLAFSSGVMFFISLFDLIPESFFIINKYYINIYTILLCLTLVVTGIIISSFIDKYFPSGNYYDTKLYHVGIISMIALIIHNIPEGIVTFLTSSYDLKIGLSLAVAIALHNIPEGISISIPIYYSSKSKKKAFVYTFISGISEFFGAILAYIFLKDIVGQLFIGCMYSVIAGIMLYISVCELLPTSIKYKKFLLTFINFILGIIFIYLSIFLIKK